MRDKAAIISCYYSSAVNPQSGEARVVWVSGVSLGHKQAKRVNGSRTSEPMPAEAAAGADNRYLTLTS
jgi:hypothetical protein